MIPEDGAATALKALAAYQADFDGAKIDPSKVWTNDFARRANENCTFVSRDDRSQRYTAVSDTTLAIAPGEFVSVVGPTGCGKSTLLNGGAGLLAPSSGRVLVFGQPLTGINARAGYMFQGEALLPWRSALDNVVAGLDFAEIG
ncbi:hypothetical protein G6F22_019501 [Rhizopus arrhizus]|nr:hypothetical protein G6F22_019501 [Rhizopus arrhizus]